MAALTADKRRVVQGKGHRFPVPVAASTTLYEGAIVCADTSGYGAVGADTASFAALGICTKKVDNSSGSNGDKTAIVERGQLEKIATSVLVQADVGKNAVIADDQTVTDGAAATNDVELGVIERIESGYAWVRVGIFAEANA